MVFASLVFTFYFLPAVLILYFLAKDEFKNGILLAASLLFYAYGEPKYVFVLIASIVLNHFLALRIGRIRNSGGRQAKGLLVLAVVLNIGLLFVCKYLGFTVTVINDLLKTRIAPPAVPLPIGISFFTFQILSYVIDVYRGTVGAQEDLFSTALYISFFPQLIAGPIVRYGTVEKQLARRKHTAEDFAEGGKRFLLGFSKKVILANNLAVVSKEIFAMIPSETDPLLLWLGSVCYTLQIFYDFSGYSDMALGLGRIFGFHFAENFDYPYIACTVTEFWRRWHISLSSWFRDYVYISLGGSRVSAGRQIFNLLTVWLLTGIWHGANYTFLFWGLGYFVLLVLEKFLVRPAERKGKPFRFLWQAVTLLSVNFLWVIFNSETLRRGLRYCLGMLGFYGRRFAFDPAMLRYLREYGIFILLAILFSAPVTRNIKEKISRGRFAPVMDFAVPVGYGLVFLWAVSFLILGAHNPFIYFNF